MIGLSPLAAHVGMTTREFTKAFAAAFHTTPHQLLLDRKITKAKRLLVESTASIAEISVQLRILQPRSSVGGIRAAGGYHPEWLPAVNRWLGIANRGLGVRQPDCLDGACGGSTMSMTTTWPAKHGPVGAVTNATPSLSNTAVTGGVPWT